MNNENNNEFDLFAPPVDDHLKEELAKGQHQWTNKYTKVLAGAVLVVTLLSAGAWYGHHSAVSATTNNIAGLRSAFGGGGFGGGAGANGAASAVSGGFAGGGGFGGVRITGKISKVSGATVTVTLDDPTQGASLKAGDTARVTDTGGSTSAASGTPQVGGATGATGRTRSSGSPSTKVPTTGGAVPSGRPAVAGGGAPGVGGGGGGAGRGAFNNPVFTDCMTKEGVTLTPGTRPDRTDPKVAAALQKCLATLGGGFGGGPGGGGTSGGTGGTGG
jgi:hypothetical protein